jgi:hypothetical protein
MCAICAFEFVSEMWSPKSPVSVPPSYPSINGRQSPSQGLSVGARARFAVPTRAHVTNMNLPNENIGVLVFMTLDCR